MTNSLLFHLIERSIKQTLKLMLFIVNQLVILMLLLFILVKYQAFIKSLNLFIQCKDFNKVIALVCDTINIDLTNNFTDFLPSWREKTTVSFVYEI